MPNETFQLLYCGDRKMAKGIFLSLLSIRHYTTHPLSVSIFSMDARWPGHEGKAFSEDDLAFFRTYFASSSISFTLFNVGENYQKTLAKSVNRKTAFSPYTLLRLLTPLYLRGDRLLYLDADTMAAGDIATLYEQPLEAYELAAVEDHVGQYWMPKGYFNAGVLLFNLPKCQETQLFEKAAQAMMHRYLFMPDQSALNMAANFVLLLPSCYNEQERGFREGTIIKHFSQVVKWWPYPRFVKAKPWNFQAVHKIYKTRFFDPFFEIYRKDFPFAQFGEKAPESVEG